jgi:hypothetical protein
MTGLRYRYRPGTTMRVRASGSNCPGRPPVLRGAVRARMSPRNPLREQPGNGCAILRLAAKGHRSCGSRRPRSMAGLPQNNDHPVCDLFRQHTIPLCSQRQRRTSRISLPDRRQLCGILQLSLGAAGHRRVRSAVHRCWPRSARRPRRPHRVRACRLRSAASTSPSAAP